MIEHNVLNRHKKIMSVSFALPTTMDESLTLIFEPDHPCNTRITKDSWHGELLYVVETEVLHPNKRTITSVRKPNGVLLATFEWKELKSDVITLGGGEPIPAGNWLKKSIIPFNE